MDYYATFKLFLLTILSNSSTQQQNLCSTDGRRILVADPSSCHRYLECRWDFSSNPPILMSVHQNDCRNFGANHFQTSVDGNTGICVHENPICSVPFGLCPPENEYDIMIANPEDRSCRQFRPCRQPDFPHMICRSPLVFNRNSGLCDFVNHAPCSIITGCLPGETGKVPGHSCNTYIFCFEGESQGEFYCPIGWWFDYIVHDCMEDIYGECSGAISTTNHFLSFIKNN